MGDFDRRRRPFGVSLVNVARGLKLLALLFFLLPWVTVSCADQTLISMSGIDLATGSVTAHNPLTGETRTPRGGDEPDLPVLVAGLLIAASLVLGFALRRGQAALVSIAALAVAAALISYTVLIRIPARADADASAEAIQGLNRMEIADILRVEAVPGFWLTLAALLAAIVVSWMVRKAEEP